MNMAEKFFHWCSDNRRDFKRELHEDIVLDFDPDAEVWEFYPNPFDTDPFYGCHTAVEFSDGSNLTFNYKGE